MSSFSLSGGQVLFFAFTYINTIYANALTAGNPALFINGQASMAKSHPEDRGYLCRLLPCHEISMILYEVFETSKKQDLTLRVCSISKRRI